MRIDLSVPPSAATLGPAFAEQEARAEALRGLADHQLRWRPPDGGWSVGQVLEHLALTNEPYIERLRAALDEGLDRTRAGRARPWKPTLLGGFIARSMTAPRKVKAAPKFVPGPDVDAGAVDRFVSTVQALAGLAGDVDGADLRVRFTSPVLSIVRPNVGDGFQLMVVHNDRHLDQIDRVMAAPGFPAASVSGAT